MKHALRDLIELPSLSFSIDKVDVVGGMGRASSSTWFSLDCEK